MNKIIFNICLMLSCNISISQVSFEGRVVYKNTFISKLPNLKVEKLMKFIGTEQEYFVKDGKYLSITNGITLPVQMYNNSENKIYMKKTTNCDTIFCINAYIETSKIIEFNISTTDETILGYKCSLLYLKTSNGTEYKYYYSDTFKINSDYFKNHNNKNLYFYLTKAKALSLKTIMENSQFVMTTEATIIERKKILDSHFELPKDAIINCK